MASWPGVLDPTLLKEEVVARNHRLADAAKAGRWAEVFEVLDLSGSRSTSGASAVLVVRPLHQAAWHGASTSVVTGLLERGALRRCPPATAGRRTTSRRHAATPTCSTSWLPRHQTHSRTRRRPRRGLASVIDGRLRLPEGIADSYGKPLEECLRYPPVSVLPECPEQRLWFAVPGMYGGFSIALMKESYLYVESWIRVVGDSGQAHVVTHEGVTLVDEGA